MSNVPTEYQECLVFTRWLSLRGLPFIHVPNEGKRSPIAGARLKAIGLQAGFPDYILFGKPNIALEMKRQEGGKVSVVQSAWHKLLNRLGWQVIVARGANDAIKQLEPKKGVELYD